mgnify:CR=1 FL=1
MSFKDKILKNLLDLKDDGSFKLNMKYFNYATGLTMTNKKFSDLFGQPVRDPKKDLLTNFHMDMASSIQAATEEIVIKLVKDLQNKFKIKIINDFDLAIIRIEESKPTKLVFVPLRDRIKMKLAKQKIKFLRFRNKFKLGAK